MTDPTDVVQRARQALDGITEGEWVYRDVIGTDHNVVAPDMWDIACCTETGARTPSEAKANAALIAAAPDLVRELADEVEQRRRQAETAEQDRKLAFRAKDKANRERAELTAELRTSRDDMQAALDRVRKLAEGWLTETCVGGYRVPDGNDSDSQCLHCAADIVLTTLDGEAQS